jgi:hypothetical protein
MCRNIQRQGYVVFGEFFLLCEMSDEYCACNIFYLEMNSFRLDQKMST